MIPIEEIKKESGKEIALLVFCCRVFLKTASPSELSLFIEKCNPDWNMVYELAKIHRIRPIIYETINSAGILNDQVQNQLKSFLLKQNLHAFHCQQRAKEIISLAKASDIPIQLYKGIHLSQRLYNHISIREFSDIDFIVKEEHIAQLISVLKQAGYKIEGEDLFYQSPSRYLAQNKDVICYHNTAYGSFLYEFHYKPIGSYLGINISFEDLLPASWRIEKEFSACDYLSLLTVNHGLIDLYPNLRCITDIASIMQKCVNGGQYYRMPKRLEGYYALNAYLVKQFFNINSSDIITYTNVVLIRKLGEKIIRRLLKRKEAGRIPTSTILKASFLLRKGFSEKLKLSLASLKYILAPNHNDIEDIELKYKWMYIFYRPFRLLQNAKRHI